VVSAAPLLPRSALTQHLTALDYILDLVAAAQVLALAAQLVGGRFIDRRAVGGGARLGSLAAVPVLVGLGDFFIIAFNGLAIVLIVSVQLSGAQTLFLRRVLRLFAEQGVAVRLRDLIVIRVDFAEGQEAVAVTAVIDERRLERRFDPRDLG
jgi:hypothetical protein